MRISEACCGRLQLAKPFLSEVVLSVATHMSGVKAALWSVASMLECTGLQCGLLCCSMYHMADCVWPLLKNQILSFGSVQAA